MITAVLIDDEQPALDELKYLLEQTGIIEIKGSYISPLEALQSISYSQPDVIFMDISMSELSGIALAKEILSNYKNIEIVFTTAFDNYAIDAFDLSAIDYILKPILKERLNKTIAKIIERKNASPKPKKELIHKIYEIEKFIKQPSNKIIVKDNEEIIFLNSNDVIYVGIEQGNSIIVTNTQKYTSKSSLDSWAGKLNNQNFFRCHRSYIVNLNHISKIVLWFNGYVIKFHTCEDQIPISRNSIKELKKMLDI